MVTGRTWNKIGINSTRVLTSGKISLWSRSTPNTHRGPITVRGGNRAAVEIHDLRRNHRAPRYDRVTHHEIDGAFLSVALLPIQRDPFFVGFTSFYDGLGDLHVGPSDLFTCRECALEIELKVFMR